MAWRHPRSLSEAAAWRVLEGLCQGSQTLQPLRVRGDALYQNAKSRLALFPSRTGMSMSLLSAPRKHQGLHFLRNVCEKSAKEVSKGMEENATKAGKKIVMKIFY